MKKENEDNSIRNRLRKQYGKGYTGLLSRLLDAAIDNEELVRKCI